MGTYDEATEHFKQTPSSFKKNLYQNERAENIAVVAGRLVFNYT